MPGEPRDFFGDVGPLREQRHCLQQVAIRERQFRIGHHLIHPRPQPLVIVFDDRRGELGDFRQARADDLQMPLQVGPECRTFAAAHLVELCDGRADEFDDEGFVGGEIFGGIFAGFDDAGKHKQVRDVDGGMKCGAYSVAERENLINVGFQNGLIDRDGGGRRLILHRNRQHDRPPQIESRSTRSSSGSRFASLSGNLIDALKKRLLSERISTWHEMP